jgi:DNA-binding NtrC family response regulator
MCGPASGASSTSRLCTRVGYKGPWTVESVNESGQTRSLKISDGERIVIGSRADCDLRLLDPCVSGRHCALEASRGDLVLTDLGSRNGVFVGNVKIESAKICELRTIFVIGKSQVIVHGSAGESLLDEEVEPEDGILGSSEPILRLKREIRQLASLRAPVLILGESGVGKDVVAKALHQLSEREGLYVPLNVATIPETLADSELFGHRKGAFTGALHARIGAFERAHQGTLFLDEIGELAPTVQAKLLRILEDGMVRPVGATEERRVEVRVVSATWNKLFERSSAGQFRFDLLQRLAMVVLEIPPLRDRRTDIPVLARCWLKRYRSELGVRHLSDAAIETLCAHDWPGNVRELGGAIYRACVLADAEVVDIDAVERAMATRGIRYDRRGRDPQEILLRAGGNVSEAARLAGLPRTTFRTWLNRSRRTDSKPEGCG